MKFFRFFSVVILSVFSVLALSTESGNAMRGQLKSYSCITCHGIKGNSTIPTFPKLAGQHASYLIKSMKAYINGARKSTEMYAAIIRLSDQDIRDVALYFSVQTPKVRKSD